MFSKSIYAKNDRNGPPIVPTKAFLQQSPDMAMDAVRPLQVYLPLSHPF